MQSRPKCLTLAKGKQRFVFWFHAGQETQLLESFARLAEDPDTDFDWYDAAVLSYQMGRNAGERTEALVGESRGL